MRTHFKTRGTLHNTHFSSCQAPGVRKGFIRGEALRLLTTNSSKTFEENITLFKQKLRDGGCPHNLIDKTLSEVNIKAKECRPYNTEQKNRQKHFESEYMKIHIFELRKKE